MKIILQIIGALIQVIGAMGIVFISLPAITAILFHGRKTPLFSTFLVIVGTLISVIFMFLGYVITKNSRDEKLTPAKKQITDVFTIVAIVGLVGVLAAMLLPAVNPVSKSGYRMSCRITKMSQIALALRIYSYNNRMPTRKFFSSEEYEYYPNESGDRGLKMLDQDFLDNKELFKCPKDKRVKKTFWEKIFASSSEPTDSEFQSDYIYLGGFHSEEDPVVPILFDKFGNHEDYFNVTFSDGATEIYEFRFSTYDDLIDAINRKKNYSKETIRRIEESLKKALENNKADSEKDSSNAKSD